MPLDSDKARLAQLNASRYWKMASCQEARSFVDNCTVKIVSILLSKLDFDNVSSREKNEILRCLKSALELVSYDLVGGVESTSTCKTLPVFLHIFDEIVDFTTIEFKELVSAFTESSGFWHLQQYLVTFARTTKFPRPDDISTIMTVILKTLSPLEQCFCSKKAKKDYRAMLEDKSFFINFIAICRGTMHHLLYLEENVLAQYGEEFFDISSQVKEIYTIAAEFYPQIMADYYDLFREFVLRLVNSSIESLKHIGWIGLLDTIKASFLRRPLPRTYIVDGATRMSFNGRYDYDENEIDPDGFAITKNREVKYIKRLVDSSLYIWRLGTNGWCIGPDSRCDDYERIDGYKAKCDRNDRSRAPRSGYINSIEGHDEESLTVTPVGLIVNNGEEFSTIEHDLVHWMFKNGVLELVVEDAKSCWQCNDIMREAVEARTYMVKLISQMLDLTLQITVDMNERRFRDTKKTKDICSNATSFTNMIMKSLLLLSDDAFRQIGSVLFTKVCSRLGQICKRISKYCYHDFKIFHSLVMLRLHHTKAFQIKSGTSSFNSLSELKEVFGASSPLAHVTEYYVIEGAGSEIVNGTYKLSMDRCEDYEQIVYVKQNVEEHKNGLTVEMRQKHGRWIILLDDERNDEIITLYVNEIGISSSPTAGWKCYEGEIYAPKLTSIGRVGRQDAENHYIMKKGSCDLTIQQGQLWDVLRQMSGPVVVPDAERTEEMERAVLYSFSSLDTTELNEIHQAFARCAQILIKKMFRKRQLSITQFLAHRKKKKPAQDDAELLVIA